MRISTKGRYGLRFLIDVAQHQHQGAVPLRDISRRQKISHKYLWNLVTPLKNDGFIEATRGAEGGYRLLREAEEISLLDIVNTLEGPLEIAPCLTDSAACAETNQCAASEAWTKVQEKTQHILAEIKLAEIVRRQEEIDLPRNADYVI